MSYTRTRHAEIPFVAHKDVSYPASPNGGTMTVRVSGTVPVDINVHVDTDHYDRNINRTTAALATVAGAVSAAEAAQVEAIRETGEQVSNHAIRGFFGLVGNELSARMTQSASTMKSSMALLLNESQSIEGIHQQMETDYQAIKARYVRTFTTLDDELRRRMRELNQQAFNLGLKRRTELLREPYSQDACSSYSMMTSTHVGELKLACASAKRKAFGTVQSLGRMSKATVAYQEAVSEALAPAAPAARCYLPVLYASVDEDDPSSPEWRLYQGGSDDATLHATVENYLAHVPDDAWQPLGEQEKSQVDNCFMALLDKASEEDDGGGDGARQQRIHDEMLRLFQQNVSLTCTTTR